MRIIAIALATILATPAFGDAPVVQSVAAHGTGDTRSVSVTLSHPDTGWDHYADGWEVVDSNGTRLGLRVLAHPHVAEQPFTRSLTGVTIPPGTTHVFIRTRCIVDGWSQDAFEFQLGN